MVTHIQIQQSSAADYSKPFDVIWRTYIQLQQRSKLKVCGLSLSKVLGEGMGKMNDKEFHTFRGYEIIKKSKEHLTPSMEDYLEMIYRYCQEEGYVRINQLAERLNVKASSASKTVSKLAKKGYLNYEKYGIIQLTAKGEIMGAFLLDRHETVETLLRHIGVLDTVLLETELIEHHLSLDTVKNIKILNDFLKSSPEIREKFRQFKAGYEEDKEEK
jgi:Mn-dependent DtxR family transcriptional regulator